MARRIVLDFKSVFAPFNSQVRRSIVHSRDDTANSIITICVAYMSLTKNTILVRSRLCMYITDDRRTVVALRRANRAPSPLASRLAARFPTPSIYARGKCSAENKSRTKGGEAGRTHDKLCAGRIWNWDDESSIWRSLARKHPHL